MAYSEIINEIQEQIDEIQARVVEHSESILAKQAEIDETEERITNLQAQLVGLTQLKTNAQDLIDNQNQLDINLNVNVNSGQNTTMTVASGSNIVQDGPFNQIMDSDRLKKLEKALETVQAMGGSPDIIQSLIKAIEEVKKGGQSDFIKNF